MNRSEYVRLLQKVRQLVEEFLENEDENEEPTLIQKLKEDPELAEIPDDELEEMTMMVMSGADDEESLKNIEEALKNIAKKFKELGL